MKIYFRAIIIVCTVTYCHLCCMSISFSEAVACGNYSSAQAMLKKNPLLANSRDNFSRTPLHYAAINGNTKIINELFRYGVNVNARDRAGITPTYLARKYGNNKAEECLIKHGGSSIGGSFYATNSVSCINKDGYLYLPLYFVAEFVEGTVCEPSVNMQLFIGENKYVLVRDSDYYICNEHRYLMNRPILYIDNIAYISLKTIEGFGIDANTNNNSFINISYQNKSMRLEIIDYNECTVIQANWAKIIKSLSNYSGNTASVCLQNRIIYVQTYVQDEKKINIDVLSNKNIKSVATMLDELSFNLQNASYIRRVGINEWVFPVEAADPIWQWNHVWLGKANGKWCISGVQLNFSID